VAEDFLQVTQWGAAARDAALATAAGRVVAVFARSFYLANAAEALACVGPPGLGSGPLNLLCELPAGLDFQASGLRPGDAVSGDGAVLRVGGRFALRLTGAALWRPPPPPTCDAATLGRGLAMLAAATGHAHGGGFAPLVAGLARGEGVTGTVSPLLQVAMPGIAALALWLAADERVAPADAAALLIGLGPGLTPSGDDLLGGAMIALHALGRGDTARRLADWTLPLAREGTGAISAAHLACAASGEGSAALHDMLAALLRADEGGIAKSVAALAAIGHSSGWDMLAGAALACAAFSG
jgi:hypothetical protein